MPLGKYYCDYCDKQFQDTPFHRKRHLQGVQHQRAKALWYASLREPKQVNVDSSFGGGVCNRFVTTAPPSSQIQNGLMIKETGSCQYGDSCKYYHPKQNPQSMNMQGIAATNFMYIPSPSSTGSQPVGGTPLPGDMVRDSMGALGNLPLSLRPPPESGYPPLPFVDWG